MADDKKAHVHPEFALKVMGALPAALRSSAELKGGPEKPYTILKVRGKSVASIRDGSCRIVHPHGATAQDAKDLAKMIAAAAPEEKPEPKPKVKAKAAAKPKADAKPEGDDAGKDA